MNSIELHRSFEPLWKREDVRYFLVEGGRGSGKSFAVGLYLLHLTYEAGHTILFTRYTMRSAEISIIPEFVEKIELSNAKNDFKVTADEIINTRTGSKIIFRGIKTSSGDQTANLKSIHGVTTWVLEEAEELRDEETFDKIDNSVRKKELPNKVILVYNPPDMEHFIYKKFILGGLPHIRISTSYLNNLRNLSQSFVEKAAYTKEKNLKKYEHIYLGKWQEQIKGRIFPILQKYSDAAKGRKVYGLDFGYGAHELALIECTFGNEEAYYRELVYETKITNTELLKRLAKFGIGKSIPIIADSASPDRIAELQAAGYNVIPARKGPGSIRAGALAMASDKIYVHEESSSLYKEMCFYSWETDVNGNELPNPIDSLNHGIDAARYARLWVYGDGAYGGVTAQTSVPRRDTSDTKNKRKQEGLFKKVKKSAK